MALSCGLIAALPQAATAWGSESHRIIGERAYESLSEPTRAALRTILGTTEERATLEAIDRACSWPDAVRSSPGWEWSGPLHYVNIPRGARAYDRQRDCPDGMCVTGAILKYAEQLSRPQLDTEHRWQAFAWVCHLVADLHQPLHAAYRDDRGGNRVTVEYRGQKYNLHAFWDGVLARERLAADPGGAHPGISDDRPIPPQTWSPGDVVAWTEESHQLAAEAAYPEGHVVGTAFADRSWLVIRHQWEKAAIRLASILEATLAPTGSGAHE